MGDSPIRLNRYIAQTGLCSRRQADEFIKDGKVRVNDELVKEMGTKISPDEPGLVVTVNGRVVRIEPDRFTYIMLNKPPGYTVTKSDPHADRTVMTLLPKNLQHVHPVGRLDKNSEGLLLLTNDGDLTQQLTHPSHKKEKEYIVTTKEPLDDEMIKRLEHGMQLEEGHTGKNPVQRIDEYTFSIVLTQGWNRQIRRMVRNVGNHVAKLRRVRVGNLKLGNVPRGNWQIIQLSQIK